MICQERNVISKVFDYTSGFSEQETIYAHKYVGVWCAIRRRIKYHVREGNIFVTDEFQFSIAADINRRLWTARFVVANLFRALFTMPDS